MTLISLLSTGSSLRNMVNTLTNPGPWTGLWAHLSTFNIPGFCSYVAGLSTLWH